MARGETFTAQVESIAAGGAGIARLNGKSIFIDFTAPGDHISGRIIKEKKAWAQAELVEILAPSPLRKKSECIFYGRCGGCSLQHLDYKAQIQAKTEILRSAFCRIGGINPPKIKVTESAPYEYRNRVRFHVSAAAGGKDGSSLGFYERKSANLVALNDCPVADPKIRKALKEGSFLPLLNKKTFTVYSNGNTFLYQGGQEKGRVSVLGKELLMDVNLFFQSNAAMLELLVKDLLSIAGEADKNLSMADIYCGVGTFASFLSDPAEGNTRFSEIDLVEENKATLAMARENMQMNNQSINVNYHCLRDTEWVKTIADDTSNKKSFSFMVLDPPREGLSEPLREWLALKGPPLAAYVSCDPATLARDSRHLIEGGYKLEALNFYDFYPQTAHIESLALFCRSKK